MDIIRIFVEVEGTRDAVRLFEQYILNWHQWKEAKKGQACVEAEVNEHMFKTISQGSDMELIVYQTFNQHKTPHE
jgi:hypothetical protein